MKLIIDTANEFDFIINNKPMSAWMSMDFLRKKFINESDGGLAFFEYINEIEKRLNNGEVDIDKKRYIFRAFKCITFHIR